MNACINSLCIILLLCLFNIYPIITYALNESFTIDDLEDLINKHNISNSKELTSHLPESYLKNFALMYESKSSQKASLKKPRIIFYGPYNSNLIFTVSGFSGGFNDYIEVISFDPVNQKFNSHQFIPDEVSKALKRMDNPAVCTGCHRKRIRPNWSKPDFWKGLYSSISGKLKNTVVDYHERQWFQEFVKEVQETNDRLYNPLFKNQEDPTLAYWNRNPGNALQDIINGQNSQSIARIIYDSPEYHQIKYSLIAAMMNLGNIELFIPEDFKQNKRSYVDTLAETKEIQSKFHHESIKQLIQLSPSLSTYDINDQKIFPNWMDNRRANASQNFELESPDDRHIEITSKLRYIFEVILQKDIESWGLSLEKNKYIVTAHPGWNYSGKLTGTSILYDLIEMDSELKEIVLKLNRNNQWRELEQGLEWTELEKLKLKSLNAYHKKSDDTPRSRTIVLSWFKNIFTTPSKQAGKFCSEIFMK